MSRTIGEKIPARLHVLLAQKSTQALIIRRGPSKRVASIGWDRKSDTFSIGQWLKGKIYPYRSDISPDGAYWIYFAKSVKNQIWTAVAKPPYLKALDFYTKECSWNGGGLFSSTRSYWLNDGGTLHKSERLNSGLTILSQWNSEPNWQGECPHVYFYRLARDGWTRHESEQVGKHNYITRFYKNVNKHGQLWKLFHSGLYHHIGKGCYFESHALYIFNSKNKIELPNMEWADIDKNRIVWAENGMIKSGDLSKEGLVNQKILFDTNPLVFTELIAPY